MSIRKEGNDRAMHYLGNGRMLERPVVTASDGQARRLSFGRVTGETRALGSRVVAALARSKEITVSPGHQKAANLNDNVREAG